MFELPSVYGAPPSGVEGVYAQAIDENVVHRIPDLQRARPTVKIINIFMISILPIGTCETRADEIRLLGALGQLPFQPDDSSDGTRPASPTGRRFKDSD
jgi:hypothetical protein